MGFVDDEDEVVWEVIDQGGGGFAWGASVEVAGVVFDSATESDFAEHFEVVVGALFEALGVEFGVLEAEFAEAFGEFGFDAGDGALEGLGGGGVVGAGVDAGSADAADGCTAEGVDFGEALDFVAEVFDADGGGGFVGGKDIDDVASDAEGTSVEVGVVSLVLHGDESCDEVFAGEGFSWGEFDAEGLVGFWGADAVDAGDAGNDEAVAAGE